jgi:Raf kinase inhibitor-like YbhB/YbcL family protein
MSFKIKSLAFENKGMIPTKYTCDGENISPPLEWEDPPSNTRSFVLMVDNHEVPNKLRNHWLIYNIPSNINSLKENINNLSKPAKFGQNSWKEKFYSEHCFLEGEHTYYFKLFALNEMLKLHNRAAITNIEDAIKPHIIEVAVLIGKYIYLAKNNASMAKYDISDAITILKKKDISQAIKQKAKLEIIEDAMSKK